MICIGRFSWKLFNIIVQKSEMYGPPVHYSGNKVSILPNSEQV